MVTQAFTTSPWVAPALVALGAACACGAILLVLLRTGLAWRLATDIPNDRSLHDRPTPRVGGWGIVPVSVATMLLIAPSLWCAAAAAAFLAAVSQIDDRRGLPARVRFAAHLIAVVGIVVLYPAPLPWWLLGALSFLMIWLVNLYNFMDGADGLAGGMALFGFTGYAVAALVGAYPLPELALASAAIAGAALGFLLFNFHPARIFLGDAGSISLGFLAGALGYWGWLRGTWPIWFPALVFAPFITDASITLARRLLRGERFWQPHREHYYQRMVRSGMGHAGTAGAWYAVMATGIILAVCLLGRPQAFQWCAVATWVVVLCLLGVVVDLRWRRFQSTLSKQSEV
ncbi:glycosyltransferase family 4 protein [Paraburkholderia sp. BL10I2N1]|uniref:MraY family glycosyltransferase n=1 Tax=Paraburkholderia sp. BL10I2N1 TaxID=1938796 RepID=UPI001061D26C|nr:glycosyltransferase family 4 protein [Paraburkholderia sp. BL10I2N1]TDN67184.1 UDP-N-acetylmuramyl pentapeptide phosphotransferase/UDP-N-acetylglucosamine-1-phosphate transferase [Paraburkholderia sp. BL10I2N1]